MKVSVVSQTKIDHIYSILHVVFLIPELNMMLYNLNIDLYPFNPPDIGEIVVFFFEITAFGISNFPHVVDLIVFLTIRYDMDYHVTVL